ncbi:MAG: hypothetical protein RLZZ501_487 [Pseudomonadota bacterium]
MRPVTATPFPPATLPGAETIGRGEGPGWRHWTASTVAAGLLHVGLLTAAIVLPAPSPPPPPAMMIDLALLPSPPAPTPPVPEAKPPQPQRPETAEIKPPPLPRKLARPEPRKPPAIRPAPTVHAENIGPTPAAVDPSPKEHAVSSPAPPPPSTPALAPSPAPRASAIALWRSALQQYLQSRKRYPRAAQSRRQEGVATIRFILDRTGNLMSLGLEQSSGTEMLDEEALDLVRRALPLPPPPPEVTGERIEVVLPIEFRLR